MCDRIKINQSVCVQGDEGTYQPVQQHDSLICFFIDFGQMWNTMAQRSKICQHLDGCTMPVSRITFIAGFVFFMGFVDSKDNIE